MNNESDAPLLIIPARGGSKRLPKKNILPINGIPLIGYVIESGLKANIFSRVLVSTEDDEIAGIAKSYGADVHIRSNELAQDRSTVVQVCCDILNYYDAELFCCIYPTSALLMPSIIRDSYKMMTECEAEFVMGVSEYNYPPEQALKIGCNGRASMMWPEFEGIQSQFYAKSCVSNGSLYWASRKAFLREKTFYGKDLLPFFVPDEQVSDINMKEDFDKLTNAIKMKLNEEKG